MPRIEIGYPQAGDRVIGEIPVQVAVNPPRPDVSLTKVTVLLDDEELFTGRTAPDELIVNTRQLQDGRHTLRVEAATDEGLSARQSITFLVSNRWSMVDRLDAPLETEVVRDSIPGDDSRGLGRMDL